jgi:hypothetical protein
MHLILEFEAPIFEFEDNKDDAGGNKMNVYEQNSMPAGDCEQTRGEFSAYLDGAMSGVEMAAISEHIERCVDCSVEFMAWRDVQRSLGELGPARVPVQLQARLLAALDDERGRGSYLPFARRILLVWERSIAPAALRVSGGLAAALVLLFGMGWMFGGPIAVQANDEPMSHLVAPRYLYSQVPPQPIETRRDVPIVVEAQVDTAGRVYDYTVIEGPQDPKVLVRIEDNLLGSVFKPATVFGVPVRGHVVMTYSGVSVRG